MTKILSLLISWYISHALMGEKKAKCPNMLSNFFFSSLLKRKTSVHKTLTCCDFGENDELANSLEFYKHWYLPGIELPANLPSHTLPEMEKIHIAGLIPNGENFGTLIWVVRK